MIIRHETVDDYAAIGAVNVRAFEFRAVEAVIVALLRQRSAFDPDLSLVAEVNGRIIGHALFSPHRLRLLDRDVPAVNLAPIGIDPAFQRQGIGGTLIEQGHAIAREKGYQLSFLLGHASYYPRFGYRTRAYGPAQIVLNESDSTTPPVSQRPPSPEDVTSLQDLWRHDQAGVDFAIEPGESLLDWLSPNPAIRSIVYERAGELVGYARIHQRQPAKPRVFLARDAAAARRMATAIGREAVAPGAGPSLTLPIHPGSIAADGFAPGETTRWNAAMACALVPGVLDQYFALVKSGERPPGSVTWPVHFDLE